MYLYLYLKNLLNDMLEKEEGQDLIEYALIAGLIAVIAVAAITAAGGNVQRIWQGINTKLTSISIP